jgi:hypothetical protein
MWGAVQYVQNHVIQALPADAPDWDGVVQLHYQNIDGWVHGHWGWPDSKEVIQADCAKFISFGRIYLLSEYIMAR